MYSAVIFLGRLRPTTISLEMVSVQVKIIKVMTSEALPFEATSSMHVTCHQTAVDIVCFVHYTRAVYELLVSIEPRVEGKAIAGKCYTERKPLSAVSHVCHIKKTE
jgi:hypothetical protein